MEMERREKTRQAVIAKQAIGKKEEKKEPRQDIDCWLELASLPAWGQADGMDDDDRRASGQSMPSRARHTPTP